jgi:hypothetical protein
MPRATPIRAVTDADVAAAAAKAATPPTISEAARDGNRLAELRAMRLILARAVENPMTPARDLASLTRRLIEVGREVEELEAIARQEGDGDERPAPDAALDPAAV